MTSKLKIDTSDLSAGATGRVRAGTAGLRQELQATGTQAAATQAKFNQLAQQLGLTNQKVEEHGKKVNVAKKAEHDLASEGSSAARALGTMGDRGAAVVSRFTSLAGVMGSSGALGLAVGAGIVGLGLVTAGAEQAVQGYLKLADQIRTYSSVTGESAEVSSRQIAAFKEMGVSEEDAQSSMLRLGRAVAETPQKFQQLGIQIAHTNDGSVDLNHTLLNTIDAWNKTSDATQKVAIIYQAFGRTGQSMLPIFVAGSKQLQNLEDTASTVFNQQDLDRARAFEIHMKEVGDRIDSAKANFGSLVAQGVDPLIVAQTKAAYVTDRLVASNQQLAGVGGRGSAQNRMAKGLVESYNEQYDAEQRIKEITEQVNQVQSDNEKIAEGQYQAAIHYIQAQDGVERANEAVRKSSLDLKQAALDETKAHQATIDAQARLDKLLMGTGPNYKAAGAAARSYKDAERGVRDETARLADVQRRQVEDAAKIGLAHQQLAVEQDKLTAAQDANTLSLGKNVANARALAVAEIAVGRQQLTVGDAVHQLTTDSLAYSDQQGKILDAQDRVTEATQRLNDALATQGPNTRAVADATNALHQAQLNEQKASEGYNDALETQKENMINAALAAVSQEEAIAGLTGGTVTAADKQHTFVTRLTELQATLDPKSPLHEQLQQYIDMLNGVPGQINTKLSLTISAALATAKDQQLGQLAGRQFGGPVQPNRDYIVGERGPELLRLGAQGGQVFPAGSPQTQAAINGGATINATFNAAGMSAWDVQRELAWMLKYGLR